MISGLDLTQSVDYTLKADKENPTIWKLGVIPSNLFAKIIFEGRGNQIDSAYSLVQAGLRGWENFNIDFKTKKQKFFNEDIDVVPLDVLGKIPLKVITELSEKIVEINQLTEDETKN